MTRSSWCKWNRSVSREKWPLPRAGGLRYKHHHETVAAGTLYLSQPPSPVATVRSHLHETTRGTAGIGYHGIGHGAAAAWRRISADGLEPRSAEGGGAGDRRRGDRPHAARS